MKASDIQTHPVSFTYKGPEGEMEVVYDENAVTSEALDEITNAGDGTDPNFIRMDRAAIRFLSTMILSWELMEDDGTPVPLEAERMGKLPTLFVTRLMKAIQDDIAPGEASATFVGG